MRENPLKDVGAHLAAMFQAHGERGQDEWSQVHRKLAEAAAIVDYSPSCAVEFLLEVVKDIKNASETRGWWSTLMRLSKADRRQIKDLVLCIAHELSMTPLANSETIPMVNAYGSFCKESVDHIVNRSAELSAPNAPYSVISIVGPPSSGKSYLLNRLFRTKFPEMDAVTHGNIRKRSLTGIMMSRCISPSLLLLDFEGFHGRAGWQDTLFQKQDVHFALAISDLVMVNMSVLDIGREQADSTLLFTTIFEMQQRTKLNSASFTKILVVVRSYDEEKPLDILRSAVLKKLGKALGKCEHEI